MVYTEKHFIIPTAVHEKACVFLDANTLYIFMYRGIPGLWCNCNEKCIINMIWTVWRYGAHSFLSHNFIRGFEIISKDSRGLPPYITLHSKHRCPLEKQQHWDVYMYKYRLSREGRVTNRQCKCSSDIRSH